MPDWLITGKTGAASQAGKRYHSRGMARFCIHYRYERENSPGAETIRDNFSAKEAAIILRAYGCQISGAITGRYYWYPQ